MVRKRHINHVKRVAISIEESGGNEFNQIAAWLHDVVEDTDVTLDQIGAEFGDVIEAAVNALTRRKDESYPDYVYRVSLNPIAKSVKIHDLSDNMSDLPEGDKKKDKYRLAQMFLENIFNMDKKKKQFNLLADKWEADSVHFSYVNRGHPNYQRIIEMGEEAIPLILERMKTKPGHWFMALNVLTGANPVQTEHRGKIHQMTADWLEWGREHGYC